MYSCIPVLTRGVESFSVIDYYGRMATTISDVAGRAGVSTATVSRFLKGQNVRNGKAIARAVTELDYQPSAIARSLKSGRTRSIGVVVPDITNPYFAAVVMGIESASQQGDYNVLLCNTQESPDREHRVLSGLAGRIDGLVLAPATEQAENPMDLRRLGVPIVFLDRELQEDDGFDSVLVDNAGGGRQAAEHLLELGHERIGVISGPLDTTPGRGRHEGFMHTLERAAVELPDAYIRIGDFRRESGYQATLGLIALPEPPTAIFAANNMMSIGSLRALHELRVRLPGELSFVGFDDIELGDLLAPPITTISRPMMEQGVLAMRLLLNRLEDEADVPLRKIVLETRLSVRGSSGPPPFRSADVAVTDPRQPNTENARKES